MSFTLDKRMITLFRLYRDYTTKKERLQRIEEFITKGIVVREARLDYTTAKNRISQYFIKHHTFFSTRQVSELLSLELKLLLTDVSRYLRRLYDHELKLVKTHYKDVETKTDFLHITHNYTILL